jgi:hypothetical protein
MFLGSGPQDVERVEVEIIPAKLRVRTDDLRNTMGGQRGGLANTVPDGAFPAIGSDRISRLPRGPSGRGGSGRSGNRPRAG